MFAWRQMFQAANQPGANGLERNSENHELPAGIRFAWSQILKLMKTKLL
jgi:hypothetical protein